MARSAFVLAPVILAPVVLAIAAFAAPARAERYSPFLDDLQSVVRERADALSEPANRREMRQRRALDAALDALDEDSATLVDDARIQVRAVSALWTAFRSDPAMAAAVDLSENRFLVRLLSRGKRLRERPIRHASEDERRGQYRAARFPFRFGRRTTAERTWPATTRRLLRGAEELDRIALDLGVDTQVPIPRGTITATLTTIDSETSFTWEVSEAHLSRFRELTIQGLTRGGDPSEPDHWTFQTVGLVDAAEGVVYPKPKDPLPAPGAGGVHDGPSWYLDGGVQLIRRLFLPGGVPPAIGYVEYYPDLAYAEDELVVAGLDPAAGTASGTFLFVMNPTTDPDGPGTLLRGEFVVTDGLESD